MTPVESRDHVGVHARGFFQKVPVHVHGHGRCADMDTGVNLVLVQVRRTLVWVGLSGRGVESSNSVRYWIGIVINFVFIT